MKITPALAYEKLRQDAQSQNKIILHKDGKFYHVYEWSAWLLKTLVCTEELQRERGDAKMLQVNRFVTKSGTHFGIERLAQHIRQESNNYQRECYVMKMDKRGYFMHIDRQILLDIVVRTLRKMANHRIARGHRLTWANWIDLDFVAWLSEEIIMLDPKQNCKIVGTVEDWEGLDHSKSLFYTMDGCGLPIGNLTSQLLSNVYLNNI